MNQQDLYTSLAHVGCRIISFEDYPTQYGSWRVSFLIASNLCEVTCNRGDSILTLTSKSTMQDIKTTRLQSRKLVSDQLEIGKVVEWVRSLRISPLNAYSSETLETIS